LSAAAEEASWRRVNIVTNTENGAGLQRHANILRTKFELNGWAVNFAHFKKPVTWAAADLNLHIEVIEPDSMRLAPINWFMPMPEWYFEKHWDKHIGRMDKVICCTMNGVELLSSRCKPAFVGFESLDMLDRSVVKERKFLHIAGKSENKNTEHVIDAWKKFDIPYPLTILGSRPDITPDLDHPNITIIRRVTDDEVRQLVNSHRFHICVSKYEGWGHYVHEALSARGVVITHNQPPLNEFHAAYRVGAKQTGTLRLAKIFEPDPAGIAEAAFTLMNKTDEELDGIGDAARAAYFKEVSDFESRICPLISQ
jgi:glycosyltransferase involved in cell wall biosynthesis